MADTLPADTGSPSVAALAPASQLNAWNAANPIGTPVKAYPWVRPEHPAFDPTTVLVTRTRSVAWPLGHGAPVVLVEGYSGGIVLSHIDVITLDEYRMHGQLAEQAHAFLDLDADSVCPFEGASRYPYLTLGGQP